jgi:uncharacterized Zn finger protein (UPF0148 family)
MSKARETSTGQFSGPCPTCRDVVQVQGDGGVVCPYCGFVLKEGSWTVDPPEGVFRDWFYWFRLKKEEEEIRQ